MCRFLLFSFLLVLLLDVTYAQGNKVSNQYFPSDMEGTKTYLKSINSDYISKIRGLYASKVKRVFKGRDKKVVKSIEDSVYIFNSEIDNELSKILTHIYNGNPEIDKTNHRFFINTSFVPNASCYGDGMYEVNLGLLATLDYNDEIAFVLCHEMAHQLLDHSLKNVTNIIAKINSTETRNKVKAIKRQKYGQTRSALSVIDDLNIDILDYSKEIESQADSLGYVLFSRTKYNKTKAISALEHLKLNDEMLLSYDAKVDSVFNFESYQFQPYWLKKSTSIFDIDKEINEFSLTSDTLKTHPEIEYRVEQLKKIFDIVDEEVDTVSIEAENLNKIAHIKAIECSIDKNQLDFAIYQLIEKVSNGQITFDYYINTLGKVLMQIYNAKKNHKLGKYVPQQNSFSDEEHLNSIRLFLHNLELGETKKLGLAFCETHKSTLGKKATGVSPIYHFFKSINQ